MHIDVKYLDKDGREHGPFMFSYDKEELRYDLIKQESGLRERVLGVRGRA